jgi:elongation factor Ts
MFTPSTSLRCFSNAASRQASVKIKNLNIVNLEIGPRCHQPLTIRCLSSSLDFIKDLRSRSGAPITECKKALQSTGNDLDAAMNWLREHGAAKASLKVQGRVTNEGLVAMKISDTGKSAALVRVASETDFAGRSSKFVEFVMEVANATLDVNDSGKLTDSIILEAPCSKGSVKNLLDEVIVSIRENISIVDSMKLTSENGILVGYVHNKMNSFDAGTRAAIVEIAPSKDQMVTMEMLQMTGKKLAMHIVAAMPQYRNPSDVPETEIQNEKDLLMKQIAAESSNKSPETIQKIVDGKIRKFYESVCLTEQQHMIEEKNPKVGKNLESQGMEVTNFVVLSIGS